MACSWNVQGLLARRIPGLAAIGLAILIWISSLPFPTLPGGHPGPALFPRVIAVLLLVAGVGLLVQRSPAERSQLRPSKLSWPAAARMAGGLGAVAAFMIILPLAGPGLAVGAGCLIMAAVQRVAWTQSVVASVASGLAAHLMFSALLGL